MASEQITANEWMEAWIEQFRPPLSFQEKWENWWEMIEAYRVGGPQGHSALLSRSILQADETDDVDQEFYQRMAGMSWPASLPLGGVATYIPLLGIELENSSICDFSRGRAIFKADPGTWRYLENKRYRDLYTELYALEPRHFLASFSNDDQDNVAQIRQRARCANLAALLLKDGTVADPERAIVTWIEEGGTLHRCSGPFYRMYNWGFGDHSPSKYILRTHVASSDELAENQRAEDGALHSVESSPLSLSHYEGQPVVIADSEIPLFLHLFDIAEYLHGNDVLCDAELFMIRSFLALHDVWYDSVYKQSLVFTCFEAAIGPLTCRARSDVLDHLRWLQSIREMPEDTNAPAMLEELIALRRAVAHGSHQGASVGEPAYRWAINHVRSMLRLCLEMKAVHHARDQQVGLEKKNYLRFYRKLRP